jgi:hypothetical protein
MIELHRVQGDDMEPVAPFKTMEEERAYWSTHSVVDDLPADAVITVKRANKTETLSVRLDPQDMAALRRQADEQGIGPTTLARMWVREHLRRRPHTE